ncbi:hypothetical protein PINS_up004755 [Pythium insidiosum]|nr:hypothetical protein PINS_up004755 [Pythium insidiosum]
MSELPAARSLDASRSPKDTKSYRLITLSNGLEALLIYREPVGGCEDADDDMQPDGEPEPDAADDDDSMPRRRSVSRNGYDTESDDDDDDGDNEDDDEDGDDHHGRRRRRKNETSSNARFAAACLTIGVGSMADPPHVKGLAHYLEHMLFMGSAKYPDENAFEAFLSAHGGYSNGSTEVESTRYLFEVSPRHFREALDMFAQFFVAPLLREEAMDRELQAVESEFNRAMQNDFVRLQQVMCETSAPGSRFDSFSWGNLHSLREVPQAHGIDVREAMIQFLSDTTRRTA